MSYSHSIVIYLYVSCSGSVTSGKRELICLLSLTCNYVVSVRRGFLLVLGMGCVFLLWHSLCLAYNYFTRPNNKLLFRARVQHSDIAMVV